MTFSGPDDSTINIVLGLLLLLLRAFGVAGPRLWNALPISLCQPHLSLGQFRRALKRIYLTVCRAALPGPSDFLLLGADYK